MHIKSSLNINSFKKEKNAEFVIIIQKNIVVFHKNVKFLLLCIHIENTSNIYIVGTYVMLKV